MRSSVRTGRLARGVGGCDGPPGPRGHDRRGAGRDSTCRPEVQEACPSSAPRDSGRIGGLRGIARTLALLVGAESSLSEEMAGVNGDMRVRATADTGAMEWTASPAGQVLRKRLHLVGEAESGQVTSLVRYLPGARFPEHDHPEGEEILVLEGTFSDHDGDAMAGTHLLNPEGHRHAPYSEPG